MVIFRSLSTIIVFATFYILIIYCDEVEIQKVYIKSVQCNVSEKFIYPNISCYPKSYSRSVSTANIVGLAKQPLNEIFVNFKTSSFCQINLIAFLLLFAG